MTPHRHVVWTLSNFETLVEVPVYRTIALRTIGIAAAVTVTDAILALRPEELPAVGTFPNAPSV